MNLTKKANNENYKFASEELVNAFVNMCKCSGLEDLEIVEMLQSLEHTNTESYNKSFQEA